MSEAGMNQTQYCAVADVVDRMLIKAADVTTYSTGINYAIVEASRMVDTFLMPYTSVPLSIIPDQVVIATADFSASVFKRRYTPSEARVRGSMQPDMINDVDGTGWFALGLKKLQEYIKDFYALKSQAPATNDTFFNPDVFKGLFARGLITMQEARKYMSDVNAAITNRINEIMVSTKTTSLTDTQTLTKNEIISTQEMVSKTTVDSLSKMHTERDYLTKRQHSFGFISGKDQSNINQGGYNQDSDGEQEAECD